MVQGLQSLDEHVGRGRRPLPRVPDPPAMNYEILPDAVAVATRAARLMAASVRAAVSRRGKCALALSGGSTPWLMLASFAAEQIPWEWLHVFQVDERVAPPGHRDRNLTHFREIVLANATLERATLHAMSVDEGDLASAAASYASDLSTVAGSPPELDLVHLGLGPDGHTASLVPGDSVLGIADIDVAITGEYQGRRRMSLTYPVLNRARALLWVVTGAEKAEAVARLVAGDPSIPAGRVRRDRALLLADAAAAAALLSSR